MRRLLAVILCTVLLLSVFTACSPKNSSDKTISFGVLAPLTGTNAEYGKGFQIATQMAADEINAKGGVNGYKIKLVVKDSKGDAKESADLARQFADDESILGIIGDFSSSCCMANAPIVDEAHLVQLSPTASNPTYASMSPYCFSIMGRQDGEAPFFSTYLLKKYLSASNIGVIWINSDWGKAAHDNFIKQAAIDGLNIVADVNYVQDEKDFSSAISKLRAANPDTVLIMDQGAVPSIINQIAQAGWKDVKITTLGPGTSQQILDLCGANANGLITSTPFFFDPTDEKKVAWEKAFKEKAGFAPTVHPACAYDCVYLLAEAAKNAGSEKITRESLRDQLQNVEYNGFTGPIKFNKDGDITRKYLIVEVVDGKYVKQTDFDYAN